MINTLLCVNESDKSIKHASSVKMQKRLPCTILDPVPFSLKMSRHLIMNLQNLKFFRVRLLELEQRMKIYDDQNRVCINVWLTLQPCGRTVTD